MVRSMKPSNLNSYNTDTKSTHIFSIMQTQFRKTKANPSAYSKNKQKNNGKITALICMTDAHLLCDWLSYSLHLLPLPKTFVLSCNAVNILRGGGLIKLFWWWFAIEGNDLLILCCPSFPELESELHQWRCPDRIHAEQFCKTSIPWARDTPVITY